jgi:CheY-like chemotaxis protein
LTSPRLQVLIVEDFEPFRQFVTSTLQERPEFQNIFEASNGLEAVIRAGELQADVVLLDIGLPGMNGIEAARRIRTLSANSRILFVSQETDPHLVRETFRAGAFGYVVKADAAIELLPAIDALLRGEKFVGKRFAGENLAVTSPVNHHEAYFYPDDAHLVYGCARYLAAALNGGNAAIFVATEAHRDKVLAQLPAHGVDVDAAIKEARYVPLDAAETLASFMSGGQPDRDRFLNFAGNLISAAANASKGDPPHVVACGECAPLLWAQGQRDAVLRLEQLWNEIGHIYRIDIQCAFVLTTFQRHEQIGVFDSICAEHSSVVHSDPGSE